MNRLRHRHLLAAISACLVVLSGGAARAQASKPTAGVVIVVDGPSDWESLQQSLRQEITAVLSSSRDVTFLPTLEGDFTAAGAEKQLEAALGNPEVDAVLGLGLEVTAAVAKRSSLPKPVILPLVAPKLQGLPLNEGTSGRKNLTYIGGLLTLERDLRRLKDITSFRHAALLIDSRTVEGLATLDAAVKRASEEVGVEATVVPCGTDVSAILGALPAEASVAYLSALPRLDQDQRSELIAGLNDRKLIVFGMRGPEDVSLGAFASLRDPKDDLRRSRRTALMLERIFNGEDAAGMSVTFEPKEQLTLNRKVAAQVGVTPRPEILIEAKLEGGTPREGRSGNLELRTAVQRAMANNFDVGASEQALQAREQGVKRARGGWLPQLGARAGFDWVDPDGASAFGPAERTLRWGIEGRQVLYSRDNFAELGTEKQRRASSEADLSTTRLDVGVSAASAYLNVLRASIVQRINEENLEQTRQNLHLAEARVAVGAAGRDEVYRWQAEIARRRTDVLTARANRLRVMLELNRLLNTPLDGDWKLGDVEIADVLLMLPGRDEFLTTDEGRTAMITFMVKRALSLSPELTSLDAAIEGQRIVVKASKQSFFAPTVSAVGGFTHLPGTWGEGSSTSGTGGVPVPARDEFAWNVGLQAELPLFAGNARASDLREQSRELSRLETQRAASAQRIERRVRDAFLKLSASYPAVELAAQAAQAAGKNLEVITDKYRRGATDIVRLIDAQNQSLLAELSQAEAVYDLLIDYVSAERTTGELIFMLDEPARQQLLGALAEFATQGAQPAP